MISGDWYSQNHWVTGGYCHPYCNETWEIYNPETQTCVCLDGSLKNNIDYCCPHDFESNEHGVCQCEHENEYRKCASRLPDGVFAHEDCTEDDTDACVCRDPYTRNSWGHCCGKEAYPHDTGVYSDGSTIWTGC